MNGYIAIYKGKRIEVFAESSYAAQCKAAEKFKARNRARTLATALQGVE